MAEQRYGKVVARGSAAFVAQVGEALKEARQGLHMPKPIEEILPRDYIIEEHTRQEFKDEGLYAGDDLAEGYVFNRSTLWVRADIAREKPEKAKHIDRHEVAHAIAAAYLSFPKRSELLTIMHFADGSQPKKWDSGGYWARPSECYADKFAEIVSGKDSPWDEFKAYKLDIKPADFWRVIDITFRRDDLPPAPEPDPLPLPDPRVPELEAAVAALTASIEELEAEAAVLNQKVSDSDALNLELIDRNSALAARLAELGADLTALASKATAK